MKPSKVTGSYTLSDIETIEYSCELGTVGPLDVIADLLTAAKVTVAAGISETLADVLEQTRCGGDDETVVVEEEEET